MLHRAQPWAEWAAEQVASGVTRQAWCERARGTYWSSRGSNWTHRAYGPRAAGRTLESNQSRLSRFPPVFVPVLYRQRVGFAFLPFGSLGPGGARKAGGARGPLRTCVSPGPVAAVVARPTSGPALPWMSRNSIGTREPGDASCSHVPFGSHYPRSSSFALVAFAALQPREALQPGRPGVALGAHWPWLTASSFLGVALAAAAAVSPSTGHIELLHARQDALGQESHCQGPQQRPPPQGRAGRRAPLSAHGRGRPLSARLSPS